MCAGCGEKKESDTAIATRLIDSATYYMRLSGEAYPDEKKSDSLYSLSNRFVDSAKTHMTAEEIELLHR